MSAPGETPSTLDDLVKTMSDTRAISFYWDAQRGFVVVNYAGITYGEGVNCADALAAAYARFSKTGSAPKAEG